MGDQSSGDYEKKFTDRSIALGETEVKVKFIIGVVTLVGVLFFVLQNTDEIAVRWLFFSFSIPLWILTVLLFGLGTLMGWVLHMRRLKKKGS